MNPQEIFCPNIDCPARGQNGKGNLRVHSQQEKRYRCSVCEKTFSATKGTIFYRLRTNAQTVMLVITLLAYGCPLQAIVKAFGFDERTIKTWWQRSGEHCRGVHEHVIGGSCLDLQQAQADEIKVKGQGRSFWMALAMMVPTRLWLGGAISPQRDLDLIQALANQIRQIALCRDRNQDKAKEDRPEGQRVTAPVFDQVHHHPSCLKVASAETSKLTGRPGTKLPRKLGMLPETRTLKMLPVTPPGASMATFASLTIGSLLMALLAALTA
jgi:transposase-like protein